MNKALDKVIVPLKKANPSAFKEGMGLHAAVEESNWVDLSTGERSMGTGYGFTESGCLQRQFAWRGFHAEAWARRDWASIQQALQGSDSLSAPMDFTDALSNSESGDGP